jgi:hypothetical protein
MIRVLTDKRFTRHRSPIGTLYIAGTTNIPSSDILASLDNRKFPDNVRGNFAFIYLSNAVTCFAVDHYSTIPIFYSDTSAGNIYFKIRDESTIKRKNEFIEKVIASHGGYNLGYETNVKGVRRVEPGSYVWNGNINYYINVFNSQENEFDPEHLRFLFKQSIERLAGNDNLLMLSGGKDSNAILGCMLHWGIPIETMTLYSDRQLYTETSIVKQLDKDYGISTCYANIEYSGKILENENDRYYSYWTENPFGAKRKAVKQHLYDKYRIFTGEGGPSVFLQTPLLYAMQKDNVHIKDIIRFLVIETMTHHRIHSSNREYIPEHNRDVLDYTIEEYYKIWKRMPDDMDLANRIIHLQSADVSCYRVFTYTQDEEITWCHPFFDWDFVYYISNLPAKYKVGKLMFKEAFGDMISLTPWKYPKNGLSIPATSKY